MATIAYVNWPIAVVGAMSATCVLYYIARGCEYIPIFSRMLIWFGKYSLVVMCAHTIERYIPIWEVVGLSDVYVLLIAKILFCTLFTIVMCKVKFGREIFLIK